MVGSSNISYRLAPHQQQRIRYREPSSDFGGAANEGNGVQEARKNEKHDSVGQNGFQKRVARAESAQKKNEQTEELGGNRNAVHNRNTVEATWGNGALP